MKCSCGIEHADWVAKTELAKVETKVSDLTNQLTAANTKVGEVQGQLAGWATKEAGWSTERAVIRAGITSDEGLAFAQHAWNMVPEASRPKGGISEWLQNRDALPKAVQVYLPQPAATTSSSTQQPASTTTQPAQQPATQGAQQQTTTQPAQTQTTATTTLPRTTTGVDPAGANPAPGRFTAEQIRAMTPEEFKANESAIMAQVKAERG